MFYGYAATEGRAWDGSTISATPKACAFEFAAFRPKRKCGISACGEENSLHVAGFNVAIDLPLSWM